jgi:hypothetical protein
MLWRKLVTFALTAGTAVALMTGCSSEPVTGTTQPESGTIQKVKPAGIIGKPCEITLQPTDTDAKPRTFKFDGDICKSSMGEPYNLDASYNLTVHHDIKKIVTKFVRLDKPEPWTGNICFITIHDVDSNTDTQLGGTDGGLTAKECRKYDRLKGNGIFSSKPVTYGPTKAHQ